MKTTRNRANTSGRALRSSTGRAGLVLRSAKREAGLVLRSAKREAGFTLLEVLVAMTIMAILGAALFTMFNQSSRTWQHAEVRTSQFSAAREMLGMMATELRQAVVNPRAGGTFGAHFYGFDKGSDPGWRDGSGEIVDLDSGQIYFVAPTETRDQGAGQDVCVIGYWVQDVDGDPEPGKLMRYCLSDDGVGWNTFDPDANIASQDLGINVQSLTFEFWDPGNEGWDNAADNWRSDQAGPPQENSLPRAVRITLVVWDPTLEPNADPTDPKVRKRFMTFTTVVQLDAAR